MRLSRAIARALTVCGRACSSSSAVRTAYAPPSECWRYEKGANGDAANEAGYTALWFVCGYDHLEVARLLLGAGADNGIAFYGARGNATDDDGSCPGVGASLTKQCEVDGGSCLPFADHQKGAQHAQRLLVHHAHEERPSGTPSSATSSRCSPRRATSCW